MDDRARGGYFALDVDEKLILMRCLVVWAVRKKSLLQL